MRYWGGKSRIAKELCKVLDEYIDGGVFVDLFVGGGAICSRITNASRRIANDNNQYVIAMWKALQRGWIPPDEISDELYNEMRADFDRHPPELVGFSLHGISFMGTWKGVKLKSDKCKNATEQTKRTVLRDIQGMKDVEFISLDYRDVEIPKGAVVYCDPPYKGRTSEYLCRKFDYDAFVEWAREQSKTNTVLVSGYKEYIPEGFRVVWEKQRRTAGGLKSSETQTEVLMEVSEWQGVHYP